MSNFDSFLGAGEEKNTTEEDPESAFTQELRQKLSVSFMKLLAEGKKTAEIMEKFAANVVGVPEDQLKSERDLNVFKHTLNLLLESPDFPDGQLKMRLKVLLSNLNTNKIRRVIDKHNQGSLSGRDLSELSNPITNPITGSESYDLAVDNILSILSDDVLTPEVYSAIYAYGKDIFAKPLDQAKESLK